MEEEPMVGLASPQGLTTIGHHWGTGLRAQMRQRHAARVQRPHGQNPEATRPESDRDTLAHTEDTLAHFEAH